MSAERDARRRVAQVRAEAAAREDRLSDAALIAATPCADGCQCRGTYQEEK